MLSNPTTSLHPRQRLHRRQHSTPSGSEAIDTQNLPITNHNDNDNNAVINRRQAAAHRRGLSLDTRSFQQMTSPTTARQDNMVSLSTNNTGLANTPQHRVLREAQQQRTQARPGPHQQHHHNPQYLGMRPDEAEAFIIHLGHNSQNSRFNAPQRFDPIAAPFDTYGEPLNMMMQRNQGSYGNNVSSAKGFDFFAVENVQSMSPYHAIHQSQSRAWMADVGPPTIRRTARRISDGIMDRVSIFESFKNEDCQIPSTPPSRSENAHPPPTPTDTAHERAVTQDARPVRFSEDFDESMEETVKPRRTRPPHPGAQNVFQDMRQQAEMTTAVPTPPRSTTFPNSETFNDAPKEASEFLNMDSFREDFIKMEGTFGSLSRDSDFLSADDLSQQATPETQQMGFANGFGSQTELQAFQDAVATHGRTKSKHRRTESIASIASAASIASINIEDTKTDTGVTNEEIVQYIQGPETSEGKWTCLYEDCGKEFGRKENIKSHVQTHLNDRQYQCPVCQKCFVRQHDLKRHAKIHTGVKPYPCECGNSFARHDALTRHRQRGMCIGAFDGVVRKVVKRGRPKKNRPDMETRKDKAVRTRRKNMSISSMSSFSGCSDSSVVNSPEVGFDMGDDMIIDMDPINSSMHSMSALSSAPMPTVVGRRTYVPSGSIMDREPTTSPTRSVASHNTTPSLTQSSSPQPAPLFGMDPSPPSIGHDELSSFSPNSVMMGSAAVQSGLPVNIGQQEEDMMLQFSSDDGLVQLERDQSMLISKFEEEFHMFTNEDDLFFSSS